MKAVEEIVDYLFTFKIKSMIFLKYGIGIDVSMDKFDACVSIIDLEQRVTIKAQSSFANNLKGFDAFYTWSVKIMKLPLPVVFLMEATGIYYEQLAWYLHIKKASVSIVLPNKAKKYKEALGLKSKTDRIDAQGLARMTCEQQCSLWKPLSDNLYLLRLVTRQIQSITEQTTALSNQLHALQYGMLRDKSVEKMYETQLTLLQKHKKELQLKVESIISSDKLLKQKFEKICKIKGLGVQSLAVIVAETNGFVSFENAAQLVSYSGYDVVANESGKRIGKTKISKQGNSRIRRSLHFPAFNMIKYEVGSFKNLYDRIYERTKIKMKGYTAVQKKLLVIVYTLWKKDQEFNNNMAEDKSGDGELMPSFASTPKELDKISPDNARAKQDRHPSKNRRTPSFAYYKANENSD